MCVVVLLFFFFKQKTAYEMRISDWSSDVCSSDLLDAVCARDSAKAARLMAEDLGRIVPLVDAAGLAERCDVIVECVPKAAFLGKIGRASCRERVCQYV